MHAASLDKFCVTQRNILITKYMHENKNITVMGFFPDILKHFSILWRCAVTVEQQDLQSLDSQLSFKTLSMPNKCMRSEQSLQGLVL